MASLTSGDAAATAAGQQREALAATGTAPASALASSAAGRRRGAEPLEIVEPAEGTTFYIDPTLRREFQSIPLNAVGARGSEVEWLVDGRPIGRSTDQASLRWPLAAGRHVVSARDARGRSDQVSIVVKNSACLSAWLVGSALGGVR